MSEDDRDDSPVNGLVDSRRAAAMLGVPANTFRVWANRSQHSETGIAAALPRPVATLNGRVYCAHEIEEFGRKIALSARAARSAERTLGAYYTPGDAATLMADWALRESGDVILEPSVGDGQFALAVNQIAASRGWPTPELYAAELDPATAKRAVRSGAVRARRLHVGDFLAATHWPMVNVVIGNPPYVRVRELSGALRRSAVHAANAAMGVEMDPAGSVWMPFVAKATRQLKDGGRLALVLPLDFTYVRYARPLWDFLGRSFGRLRVLRFRERVFPDILQNVLILLAEDRGKTTRQVELIAHNKVDDLSSGVGSGAPINIASILAGERAFQIALLPSDSREALNSLGEVTSPSSQRAKFNIGYVSGNKRFFHPEEAAVKEFRLPPRSLTPTLATSRQLSGQGLRTSAMTPSTLLWNPRTRLTAGEKRYVEEGERQGVDMAYKCRIRKPWYQVPGVKVPDLFMTTFSEVPRVHLNDAGWFASNSVLAGYMHAGEEPLAYISSWYTPLTLLSTEIEVHSLGGGVMIAVPREADSVQILKATATRSVDPAKLDRALTSRDPVAAYTTGNSSISRLIGKGGLEALWSGVEVLQAWRRAQAG